VSRRKRVQRGKAGGASVEYSGFSMSSKSFRGLDNECDRDEHKRHAMSMKVEDLLALIHSNYSK